MDLSQYLFQGVEPLIDRNGLVKTVEQRDVIVDLVHGLRNQGVVSLVKELVDDLVKRCLLVGDQRQLLN